LAGYKYTVIYKGVLTSTDVDAVTSKRYIINHGLSNMNKDTRRKKYTLFCENSHTRHRYLCYTFKRLHVYCLPFI